MNLSNHDIERIKELNREFQRLLIEGRYEEARIVLDELMKVGESDEKK